MTEWAPTVVPSDHFQPFSAILTVLSPLLHTGASASDNDSSKVGSALVTWPNQ